MSEIVFSDEENRLDSGMEPGERGSPATLGECELAAAGQGTNTNHEYCQFLLNFLVRRVKRLFRKAAQLEEAVSLARELNEALRQREANLLPLSSEDLEEAIGWIETGLDYDDLVLSGDERSQAEALAKRLQTLLDGRQ